MLPVKILIIEDNDGDYDYICEILNGETDFTIEILRGQSLEEAENLSTKKNPDLILLDLGLPDSFGLETLESMVHLLPYTPIIVLTGFLNDEIGLDAIKKGAQDFICKNDLTTKTLVKSIMYSLERKKYIEDFKTSQQKIAYLLDYSSDGICLIDNNLIIQDVNSAFTKLFGIKSKEYSGIDLSKIVSEFAKPIFTEKIRRVILNKIRQAFDFNYDIDKEIWYEINFDPYPNGLIIFARNISDRVSEQNLLNDLNESLQKSTDSTIGLLSDIIELKEPYTAGHQERVSYLCELIANELKIPRSQKDAVVFAARIYDVGKTAIPAEILSKPSSLSKNEMSLVKYHVESGYNLVKKMDTDMNLADIVLQHHERIDGSGYPNGITGKEMLIESKILAVADVVDAMLSHRPYRSAFSPQKAIEELEQNKSVLYDTAVSNACINILKSDKFKS